MNLDLQHSKSHNLSTWKTASLHGWGRYPRVKSLSQRPTSLEALQSSLNELVHERSHGLVFAHGRSYGDSCLPAQGGRAIHTRGLNRILDFNPNTGWVHCETGVSIYELIQKFLPQGFFPPVVPGTQFVTLGGALCNDIHGKNHHHDGTFADHIRKVELLTAQGEVVFCDAENNSELFWSTVGGLGLTGLILSMELKLTPVGGPGIKMESIKVKNLDHFFELSSESSHFTHTVSWIDCLAKGSSMGRGIFMRGRHCDEIPQPRTLGRIAQAISPILNVPFSMPNLMLNPLSIKAFNALYYGKHPQTNLQQTVTYEPFFFPLDFVKNWNRIYGRRGFLQYQMVVPKTSDNQAIRSILNEITKSGMGSFLAVIKEFGDREHKGLSFPAPGVTLALDFPHYGQELLDLFNRLDQIVIKAGGRVYLGKDARLPKAHFQEMYPEWQTWKAVKDQWDPECIFRSMIGERLGLC